jgi:hypothetical protein
MVFVVGARRSGTNWRRRMLDAHPAVAGIPAETHLFSHGVRCLADRVQHGTTGSTTTGRIYMDRGEFAVAARRFCDGVFESWQRREAPVAQLVGEHTPLHVHHLDLIGAVYPDAAVLHIVRDGRDVARSLLRMSWGPASATEAAEEWAAAVTDARAVAPALSRYREVRYEELLADPRRGAEDLYRWLGIDTAAAVLDAAGTEAAVAFNVDMTDGSVGAGKWRRGLSADEAAAVMAVAGPLLGELGYLDDDRGDTDPEPPLASRLPGSALDVARAVRTRLRRRPDPIGRMVVDQLEHRSDVFDQVFGALIGGVPGDLADRFTRRASVRVVGPEGVWAGRGPDAVARAIGEIRDDAGTIGPQERGDVHPGLPAWTIVTTHRDAGGRRHHRVFVDSLEADRIDGLTYYRLPGA